MFELVLSRHGRYMINATVFTGLLGLAVAEIFETDLSWR